MNQPLNSPDPMRGLDPRDLMREAVEGKKVDPRQLAEEERIVRAEVIRHLPDVELFELLGRGGMGFVWRARQRRLDREVALKVLDLELGEKPDFAERFAREARALAKLNHPNIVTVFDYGQKGSFCYLIMELVDGTSLREVVRHGKLEPAEALALVPGICDALQYAHEHGVVHRDIKPENILLDAEGRVKIADFGLAKLVGTPAALVTLTGSQQVLGTLRYMAPEQLDRPLEVDHRADIYSLGVVFYEMLTGEIPMGRFDPPSVQSGTGARLDDIVMRTLEKEPDQRYQRAGDVKTDVSGIGAAAAASHCADACGPGGKLFSRGKGSSDSSPRLSKLAVASAVLFGISLVPILLVALVVTLTHRVPPPEDPAFTGVSELGPAFAEATSGFDPTGVDFVGEGPVGVSLSFLTALIGLPILPLLVGSCVMGWFALDRIRRHWPRLQGASAAVIGAWGFPAVLLSILTIALAYSPFLLDDPPTPVPDWFLAMEVMICLAANAAGMNWYYKRFLKRCEAEA